MAKSFILEYLLFISLMNLEHSSKIKFWNLKKKIRNTIFINFSFTIIKSL